VNATPAAMSALPSISLLTDVVQLVVPSAHGGFQTFTIQDGTIVSFGESRETAGANEYGDATEDMFRRWLTTEHPDDVPTLYAGEHQRRPFTEESIALFGQRTLERRRAGASQWTGRCKLERLAPICLGAIDVRCALRSLNRERMRGNQRQSLTDHPQAAKAMRRRPPRQPRSERTTQPRSRQVPAH
jgi:hypothetical protein